MKTVLRGLLAASAMICLTTPCLAQDVTSFAHSTDQRTGAYGGVNLRLEFGRNRRPTPVARIAVGLTQEARASGDASARRNAVPALEVGLTRSGGPELFVAGQSTARIEQRLGARGLGLGPVEIVFAVALTAVTILVVSGLDDLGDAVPTF
jgi:hypothetical protein